MTTSDPDSGESPIDDPDWIKGLVAKALLQAAEDDPDPLAPVPDPPAHADGDDRAVAASDPENIPPANSAGTSGAPLIIGRGLDDTPLLPTSASNFPGSGGSTDSARPAGSDATVVEPPSVEPPYTEPPYTEPPYTEPLSTLTTATAIVDTSPGESTLLTAEPVRADSAEPTPEESRDHVMVEEDATIEGFRSSDIRTVLEWLAVIVSALVVALVIKAFVLQAFWIPSESMESTVNKGDRILVNKLSYRLHDIRRGDLVVFKKLPGTPGDTEDLIKRAIALPGETIEVRDDGRIWIWGPGETPEDALLLQEPYLDPRNERLPVPSTTDSLSTDMWDDACTNQPRTPGRCTLGSDQYFMMGDNRASSSDSRFFGPVPEELVVGRAFLRIWPLGELSSL